MPICSGCPHPMHPAGECRFNGCHCTAGMSPSADASPSLYDVWNRIAVSLEKLVALLEKSDG